MILVACSNSNEQISKISFEDAFTTNAKFTVRGYVAEFPHSFYELDQTLRNEKKDQIPRLLIYGKVSYWKEADNLTKKYIEEYGNNIFAHDKVHNSAALMLDKYLLEPDLDKDPQLFEAIAFYTEVITEYGTYESKILAKSLRALDGYWTKDKISLVAKTGLGQIEKFKLVELDYDFLGEEVINDIKETGRLELELFR